MKKYLILILLLSSYAWSQSVTSVTATLTDSTSQVWANASYTAVIQPPFGNPNPLNNLGFPIQNPLVTGFADGSGNIALTLDNNLVVAPAGSTYKFTICPNATVTNCSISVQVISGLTQNLSASISNDLIPISVQAAPTVYRTYTDSQVNGGQGSIYWRVSDNTLRGFNGISWVSIGTGGGGGGPSKWSDLLNPTANLTLGMGNFTTLFTYGSNTGTGGPSLQITDTTNNTGTNYLFQVSTASGSTANPFQICSQGTANCISMTSTGVFSVMGTAQNIATGLNSNQPGSGEIFLGSSSGGQVSGANQVAIAGNFNKLYVSENQGTLAKVLLGGQVNAGSNNAVQSIDINGVVTSIAVPPQQFGYGTSASFNINANTVITTNITLNHTFPDTNYVTACSVFTPPGVNSLNVQGAIPSTGNAVTISVYNSSGSNETNMVVKCLAIE